MPAYYKLQPNIEMDTLAFDALSDCLLPSSIYLLAIFAGSARGMGVDGVE